MHGGVCFLNAAKIFMEVLSMSSLLPHRLIQYGFREKKKGKKHRSASKPFLEIQLCRIVMVRASRLKDMVYIR
jgi:hypothetical protein